VIMGDVIMAVRAGRRARLHEKRPAFRRPSVRRAITALPPRLQKPTRSVQEILPVPRRFSSVGPLSSSSSSSSWSVPPC
jgi:hypothetical protein